MHVLTKTFAIDTSEFDITQNAENFPLCPWLSANVLEIISNQRNGLKINCNCMNNTLPANDLVSFGTVLPKDLQHGGDQVRVPYN